MKNIKLFSAALIFMGFAVTGFAQNQAQLEDLKIKTLELAEKVPYNTIKNKNLQPGEIINQVPGDSTWENESRLVNLTWHRWGGTNDQQFSYAEVQTWSNNNWVNNGRETNVFNTSDLPLSNLVEEWDVNTYAPTDRTSWSYDAYGNQESNIEESYDRVASMWDTLYGEQSVFTYNPNNSVKTETIHSYNQFTGWETDRKLLYNYTSGTNPTEVIYLMYNNGSYDTASRIAYTYHANGEILEETNYMYDNNTHSFIPETKGTYTYNSSDAPTSYMMQSWDNGTWINEMRQSIAYNAKGDITELLIELPIGSDWMTYMGFRFAYVYDQSDLLTEVVISMNQGASWSEVQKQIIIYTPSNIAKKTSQIALEVYPNPTADLLNLKLDMQRYTVTITDLAGRNVLYAQNDRTLDVSNLKSGVYMIHFAGEKGNAVVKFVKN